MASYPRTLLVGGWRGWAVDGCVCVAKTKIYVLTRYPVFSHSGLLYPPHTTDTGTHTAKHTFCSRCGVTAFYHPRSNPDGVAVTLDCLVPRVPRASPNEGPGSTSEVRDFDGQDWEGFIERSGIRAFSKHVDAGVGVGAGATSASAVGSGAPEVEERKLGSTLLVADPDPDEAQVQQILALYVAEYEAQNWLSLRDLDSVQRMLKAAKLLVVALSPEEHELIGFGMVSGDLSDPLIEDVIVGSAHRKQGLGQRIMQTILSHEKLSQCARVELYCKPQVVAFYARLGFEVVRGSGDEKRLMRKVMAGRNDKPQ